jgi:hypothetical protein
MIGVCLCIPSLDPAEVLFRGLSLHMGAAQILASTLLCLPLRVRVTGLGDTSQVHRL